MEENCWRQVFGAKIGAKSARNERTGFFSRDSEGAFGMESATPQTPLNPSNPSNLANGSAIALVPKSRCSEPEFAPEIKDKVFF